MVREDRTIELTYTVIKSMLTRATQQIIDSGFITLLPSLNAYISELLTIVNDEELKKLITEIRRVLRDQNMVSLNQINPPPDIISQLSLLLQAIRNFIRTVKEKTIKKALVDFINRGDDDLDVYKKLKAGLLQLDNTSGSESVSVIDLKDTYDSILPYFERISKNELFIKTGFQTLDTILGGGLEYKRLAVVMAPTGTGKSLFMLSIISNIFNSVINKRYSLRCRNDNTTPGIVYISNENTHEETIYRLYRQLAYHFHLPVSLTAKPNAIELANSISEILNSHDINLKLKFIYIPPYTMDIFHINDIIQSYELRENFRTELLVVDYADRLLSGSLSAVGKDNTLQDWRVLGYIFDELKSIAILKDCVLLTASQVNRAGYQYEVGFSRDKILTSVSRSIMKLENADIALYLNQKQTDEGLVSQLSPNKEYICHVVKNRAAGLGMVNMELLDGYLVFRETAHLPRNNAAQFITLDDGEEM